MGAMRVQPCPGCGAKYNATGLEDGASFRCRRCEATVVVGGSGDRSRGTAPGLAFAGLLMLGATFLYANPRFGERPRWPWEEFAMQENWLPRVAFIAWAASGLWALVAAFVPAARVRSLVAVGLASALALLCTTGEAGFRIDTMRLPQLLATIALGAGFVLRRDSRPLPAARWLVLGGGLALLAWPALHFVAGGDITELRALADRLGAAISSSADQPALPAAVLWDTLLPILLALLAAVVGVVAGLGLESRTVNAIGLLFLVAAILLPTIAGIVGDFESLSRAHEVRRLALGVLVAHGLALWTLGIFAVADLARASIPSPKDLAA
jgi:hypothetical protein